MSFLCKRKTENTSDVGIHSVCVCVCVCVCVFECWFGDHNAVVKSQLYSKVCTPGKLITPSPSDSLVIK
jgi:hypothetical protein